MSTKTQLRIVITLLVTLGLGAALYKHFVLGFPFFPEEKVRVWTVEARISFVADGGPVEVRVNAADNTPTLAVLDQEIVGEKYTFTREQNENNERVAVWRKDRATGEQVIYYRVSAYRRTTAGVTDPPAPLTRADLIPFSGAAKEAARLVVEQVKKRGGSDPVQKTRVLLAMLNGGEQQSVQLLLQKKKEYGGFLELCRQLLLRADVPVRRVKGLFLDQDGSGKKLASLLEVYDGSQWRLVDPRSGEIKNSDSFLLWQQGDAPVLEVMGGHDSSITFTINSSRVLASRAAMSSARHSGAMLIDFSIYSLPLAQQNTFKILLLIPLGALVVVILRNLVGIQTSGTFMPILIALAFLQTTLLWGLFLFLVVVSVGLFMRSYLSHLNLLLVPRISAVLVFVIFIFVAISVLSVKLDFEQGLRVSLFPMIIISWTIERMSVLWEEEGGKDVLIQGSGSLFTACLVYLVMTNRFLGHLTYAFPELLLVLLAIILMIGSYSGYRLSELLRFEPMTRES